MPNRLSLAAATLAVLCSATTAQAQYRADMPDVARPRPASDPAAAGRRSLADFARWNQARRRPAVLVLWERTFSDETTSRSRLRLSEDARATVAPGVSALRREVTISEDRIDDSRTPSIDSDWSAALEDAYLQFMLAQGATIMDRNALMRRASLDVERADRADMQFIEALALDQGVRYLIEVLPRDDAGSPTGLSTTVKITDLSSARIVSRFVTSAAPPLARPRLVAGAGGFHRETPSAPTADAIGAQLALESLESLSGLQ